MRSFNRLLALSITLLAPLTASATGSGAVAQTESNRAEGQPPSFVTAPERHVVLMPVAGIWSHPLEGSGWTAKPGPAYGLDIKLEPSRWFVVRATVLYGKQGLETSPGELAPGFDSHQPALKFTHLQLRAEPTVALGAGVSGYVGFGFGWGRFVAPEVVATPRLHSYDRTGVYLAYEGALGLCYELIPDRLQLDFSVAAALLSDQSGTAFGSVQGFTDSGHRVDVGGLPQFSAYYRSALGLGLVL